LGPTKSVDIEGANNNMGGSFTTTFFLQKNIRRKKIKSSHPLSKMPIGNLSNTPIDR